MRNQQKWVEVRGIEAWRVAEKCMLIVPDWKKRLLWFLQAYSWSDGGLKHLATELVKMFPERCDDGQSAVPKIEKFVRDLCTDPKLILAIESKCDDFYESECALAREKSQSGWVEKARLDCFYDVVGALAQFKARHEADAASSIHLTAIGRQVWEGIDFARTHRKMVLITGREGRGKTVAGRAYFNNHWGDVRYASIEGKSNDTLIFREIANALGIGVGFSRTIPELKMRIKDILKRSRICLVIDEAHFVFQRATKMTRPPDVIDWIDTALCNEGVGVALISTPQFLERMGQAAVQTGWNYRQFERRVSRVVTLAEKNTRADIEAVIKRTLPGIDKVSLLEVYAHVATSKLDISAVGDIATEVKNAGAEKVTPKLIQEIVKNRLCPGLVTFARAIDEAQTVYGRKRKRDSGSLTTPPAPSQLESETGRESGSAPVISRGRIEAFEDTLSPV